MKTKSLIAAIAIIASASMFTSCGGSKVADTKQVKSYILMTSASFTVRHNYVDEYIQRLEQGKVKDVFVPDVKSYPVGNDIIDENPWLQKTRDVLNYPTWTLDPESSLLTIWDSNDYLWRGYDFTWYAKDHHDDDSVVGLTVTHGFVKFIEKKAGKSVKIYDSYYSKDYSTKSVDAYYVIYTIDKDFYVLVRLAEEKKSSRFEIETLASGEQLIEIERTLNLYL